MSSAGLNSGDVVDFVEALRLHDIGKSIHLANSKHTRTGFSLLHCQGRSEIFKLTVLLHSHGAILQNLADLPPSCTNIPPVVFLAGMADRLAAASLGIKDDVRNEPSWQNPFSRIPSCIGVEDQVLLPESRLKTAAAASVPPYVRCSTYAWMAAGHVGKALCHSSPSHVGVASVLKVLRKRMKRFPERTYPPENDTSLEEHCRLSGAIGFLMIGNQAAAGSSLPRAVRDSAGEWNVDGQALAQWHREWKAPWPCLKGHLLKVHFRGAEERFRSALRLDDLHGLLAFLGGDRKQGGSRPFLRREFDREFGRGLRDFFFEQKGEGAWEAVAPIQETPFELLYLLPGAIEKEKVVEVVQKAYGRALKSMAWKLTEECGQDFQSVEAAPKFGIEDILASLQGLGLGIAVDTFEPEESPSSEGVPKAFSEALLASYGRVQGPVGEASAPKPEQILSSAAGGPVVPCAVCQLSPVFEAFYERLGEPGGELLRKVVYDEKEDRLCQGCLAIRVRSHMRVQVEGLAGLIRDCGDGTVRFEESDEGPPLPRSGAAALPVRVRREGGWEFGETDFAFFRRKQGGAWNAFPTLGYAADSWSNVVFLEASPCLKALLSRNLVQRPLGRLVGWADIKALCSKAREIIPLAEEVFEKTTSPSFGRDHLLTQTAQGNLDQIYSPPPSDLVSTSGLPRSTSWFENLVEDYLKQHGGDGVRQGVARSFWGHQLRLLCSGHLDSRTKGENLDKIDLHMARLLERIRSIGNFYEKLLERLIAARIPTLPLETSYPRLLLAAPADRLPEILTVVLAGLGEDLLGYPKFDPEKAEHVEDLLEILEGHVPPVLGMMFSVFKKKQPLYQVMAASERMAAELAEVEPQTPEGDWDWRCAHLGFRDLRGSLSIHGSPQVKVEFKKALRLLPVVKRPEVDRRSLARVGPVRQEGDLDREARLEVLADRRHWVKQLAPGKWDRAIPEALADKAGFDLVSFLAHVARR